ncbi:MAG: hypothetical protein C4321_00320 [Chloroflexota bacterium]
MSSFAAIPFKVEAVNEHYFPGIEISDNGIPVYQAKVWVFSRANMVALSKLVTIAEFKRARRSKAIMAHIDAGPGEKPLTIPVHKGTTKTFSAVLTQCNITGEAGDRTKSTSNTGAYVAECTWVITSDINP